MLRQSGARYGPRRAGYGPRCAAAGSPPQRHLPRAHRGGTPPLNRSLPARVAEVIAELPPVTSQSVDGIETWSVSGQAFAVLGPSGIEILLDPAIAAAATRTPDAAPSQRGTEWVRFNPRELDGHAVDRLRAWLELAYSRAEG